MKFRKRRDASNKDTPKKLYLEFDSKGDAVLGETGAVIDVLYGAFAQNSVALYVKDRGFVTVADDRIFLTELLNIPIDAANYSLDLEQDASTGSFSLKSSSEQGKVMCFHKEKKKMVVGSQKDEKLECHFKNDQYSKKSF